MKLALHTDLVSMVQYKYNVNYIYNFTFSSGHILNSKKKLVKLILIYFVSPNAYKIL